MVVQKSLSQYSVAVVELHFADLDEFSLEAVIDTGAFINCISGRVVLALGLKGIDIKESNHPIVGASVQPIFDLALKTIHLS